MCIFIFAAVARVLKRQHVISGHPFKVFPYYESLRMALYGKDRPTWKLPDAFTEDIDSVLQKCLQENPKCSALIRNEMTKLFSEVDLQLQPARISPSPSLLQQKKITAKLIRSWRDNAASGFKELLSRFKCLQLHVPAVAWTESELAIKEAVQQKDVSLVLDQTQKLMIIAGLHESVDNLGDLKMIVEKITKKAERELNSQNVDVPLAFSMYHLLEHVGLHQKIMNDFPELKFTYNKSSQNIEFYGLQNEILSVKACFLEEALAFSRNGKLVDLDDSIIRFLCEGDQEELNEQLFMSQEISAALEIQGNRVNLLAKTEETLRAGEAQLEKLLTHSCIEVDDSNVLRMSEWQQLVNSLQTSFNQSESRVTVHTDGTLVVVSGFVEAVDAIQKQLHDFVHDNSSVTRTETGRKILIKFIREQKGDVWKEMTKDDIKIDFREDSVSLCGPRVRVTECLQTMKDLISSVHHDVLRVAKPGAKKSFLDKETLYVGTAISKWGCLVQLADEVDTAQENASGRESKPVYHLQTPDGVEINVFKADMSRFRADAVVNAANETLQHDGGLAAALLEAAGPQLQELCDEIISSRGHLATGEVVVTAACGQLQCEHIIHAVGPRFSSDNPQRAVGLLKRAVKGCLTVAETYKYHSLAIPAISSGVFGFPLDICADTIVGAIKEHCEDMYGDCLLKKIHLVNKDDKTVQAMVAAVRKMFSRPVQPQPQDRAQVNTTQSLGQNQDQRRAHTSNTAHSVKTKEGLIIALLKGQIQDTTVSYLLRC